MFLRAGIVPVVAVAIVIAQNSPMVSRAKGVIDERKVVTNNFAC